jgi:hypothetical protein
MSTAVFLRMQAKLSQPFTAEDETLLLQDGWIRTEEPAHWEDIGGPESGPELDGHEAYTIWEKGDYSVIVYDGEVADAEELPPGFKEWCSQMNQSGR